MADDPTKLSDDEWRERLDPERYRVLRCSGTEAPFTGAYWSTKTPGTYVCAGCEAPLFRSTEKYDSGSGWPSFYDAVPGAVAEKVDRSHFMVRTEIVCARCGGHLGHVFPDGPRPTGLRYCTNSASLTLVPDEG